MGLISCIECGNKISSFATICPHCGYPITYSNIQSTQSSIVLPEDLNIGSQFRNWNFDAAFEGIYHQTENFVSDLPNGKTIIALHANGIRMLCGSKSYDIHKSQIINVKNITKDKNIIITNGLVIVRSIFVALIGILIGYFIVNQLGEATSINLLAGKNVLKTTLDRYIMYRSLLIILTAALIGSIIGGLSGLKIKNVNRTTQYVTIEFWEENCNQPQSITIECDDKQPIVAFIARQQREHNTKTNESK